MTNEEEKIGRQYLSKMNSNAVKHFWKNKTKEEKSEIMRERRLKGIKRKKDEEQNQL